MSPFLKFSKDSGKTYLIAFTPWGQSLTVFLLDFALVLGREDLEKRIEMRFEEGGGKKEREVRKRGNPRFPFMVWLEVGKIMVLHHFLDSMCVQNQLFKKIFL